MKRINVSWKMLLVVVIGFFYLVLFNSCNFISSNRNEKNDFEKIVERGKLVAITQYNSTDYFIYRGEPMGYQLELLQLLANYLDLKLEVIVNNELENNFKLLNNNTCDLLAINLTITKPRSEKMSFTSPIGQTKQVLIQRSQSDSAEVELIRNQLDLIGEKVYLQKQSAYVHRLKNLSEEIGGDINIVEVEGLEDEELIQLVAEGKINYTVCDQHIAIVSKKYYPNIDIITPVSFPQNLAWAVGKNSEVLLDTINNWLESFKKTTKHALIYNKYFRNNRSIQIHKSEYFANTSGKVSPYDELIKKNSEMINWDWRLLASLICQESNFRPHVRSWAGAFGLMQLMPSTARSFGASRKSSIPDQVAAGVKFIKWLDKQLKDEIPNNNERIKFILGGYNAGLGHVRDAQRLAKKFNKNPYSWDDVSYFLLNKSNPKYYNDPTVIYGYCRGSEPFNYVIEILERYNHYKNIIAEN